MQYPADEPILPVEETVAHKTDVLDWAQIHAESCELEFRPDVRLGLSTTFRVLMQLAMQMALVCLAAWAVTRPMAVWIAPLADRTGLALLSVALGVGWAVVAELIRDDPSGDNRLPSIEPESLGRALLPPLIWQAFTLTGKLQLLAGAFHYYLLVSLPAAVLFSDRLATHAVFWFTASQSCDHAAKAAGRRAWNWRLFGCPSTPPATKTETETSRNAAFTAAIRTANGYRWGLLWLMAATLAAMAFVALTNDDDTTATVGLQLALGTTFGLLAAVLLRCGGEVGVVTQFFAMLVHWSIYGWRDRLPPWVFRSPCGGWPRRQLTMLLMVALLSAPSPAWPQVRSPSCSHQASGIPQQRKRFHLSQMRPPANGRSSRLPRRFPPRPGCGSPRPCWWPSAYRWSTSA